PLPRPLPLQVGNPLLQHSLSPPNSSTRVLLHPSQQLSDQKLVEEEGEHQLTTFWCLLRRRFRRSQHLPSRTSKRIRSPETRLPSKAGPPTTTTPVSIESSPATGVGDEDGPLDGGRIARRRRGEAGSDTPGRGVGEGCGEQRLRLM
ncbi:unnamed protein product, partial [Linum tenue]